MCEQSDFDLSAVVSDAECEALLEKLASERDVAPSYLFEWPRLHRFILGNDHCIPDAAAQFRKMLKWRVEVGMEMRRPLILGKPWHPDSVPGLARLFRTTCADAGTHLADGSLLWLQCDGRANLEEIRTVSEVELFDTMHLMCELREEHLDKLSVKHGRLMRTVQVRDLWGLSIPNLIKDRALMAKLKKVMSVVPMAFPETLSTIVILNVPVGFNLLWSIISPMFHPRMRRKLHILRSDFLEELAQLLGTRGLEAIVHHWRRDKGIDEVEVKSGCREYMCLRIQRGEVGEWSFNVGPKGGSGLHFGVSFIGDEDSIVRVVKAPVSKAGAVLGHYRVEASGLLWLSWSNPGGWARRAAPQSAFELQLRVRPETPAGASPSSPAFFVPSKSTVKERSRPADCGCFSMLALFSGQEARALATAPQLSAQSERVSADVSATPLAPEPRMEVLAPTKPARKVASEGLRKHNSTRIFEVAAVALLFMVGLIFSSALMGPVMAYLPF